MAPTAHHSITLFVDDEAFPTDKKVLSVREILVLSGNEPPEQFTLHRLDEGGHRHKYESLEEEVHLHDGIKFAALYCGETPYSEPTPCFGANRLILELSRVGVRAEGPFPGLNGEAMLLVPDYSVRFGRFAGRTVDLGVPVLADFPTTLPRGLFVTPALLPSGAFGVGDPGGATSGLPGQGWLYWSRPMPTNRWNPERPGLSIIRHWDTIFADERFYAA